MSKKLLITDDSKVNRKLLFEILHNEYELLEAENGKQALDILELQHDSISAVLLDIIMPVTDGYEVLAAMKNNNNMSHIPVIVITASEEPDTEIKALNLGANDFVSKPFNPELIKQRLRNLINLHETAAIANAVRTDALTGLYSRAAFFEKAAEMVKDKPAGYYVMACFDVDNFKVINDQYGNNKGDEILKYIAKTFEDGFVPRGGICCRIAADNFAVLYPSDFMNSKKLHLIRKQAAELDGSVLPLTFSIGRYIVDDLSLTPSAMYDRAAIAEVSVKGRYDVHIAQYDESMRKRLLREQEITGEMKSALSSGQFEVWYQPQYNHSTGALVGSEALVRWRHPEHGLVSPGEFIPVFEKNGFIYEVDRFVWEQACVFLRSQLESAGTALPVSVNISRHDIFRNELTEVIYGLVKKYSLPPELLRLEITESAFSTSADQIIKVVKELIGKGFTIEIDDFGSGYSSLNTLKDVPAQVVKLDMRFLEGKENSSRGGNIIESVVRMTKWLGMSVIAEGVETVEQADFLKSIGCMCVQGYLYARPMPRPEYEQLIGKSVQEKARLVLETVENLDNNAFWDPESMDTLIFSSYVGGACIFEYYNGSIELLRANDKYASVIGSAGMTIDDAIALEWSEHLDEENLKAVVDAINESVKTNREVTREFVFLNLPNCPERTYLRSTMRVIASTGERLLVYCTNENITAQREAQQGEKRLSEQLKAIMDNVGSGITAAIFRNEEIELLFSNDKYYEILGYTREEYKEEVKNPFERILPEDTEYVHSVINDVVTSGETRRAEYRVKRRDGTVIWMRIILSAAKFEGIDDVVQLSIMSDISSEKQAAENLKSTDEQLKFLNDTAHDVLAQPDIDKGIEQVLSKLLDYFKGGRVYIFEFDYDNGVSDNTYEVCAQGVTSEKENLQRVPMDIMHFWIHAFDNKNYVNIEDVDALDDSRAEERETLREQGIKSLVAVPLRRDGKLIGFIGVDDPTVRRMLADRLEAIGDYIAVMLTRRDLAAKIDFDRKALEMLMNDTPGGFCRIRVHFDGTAELVYTNEGFCNLVGMTHAEVVDFYNTDAMNGMHPDDAEAFSSAYNEMFTTGEFRAKYRLHHGNGGYIWVMAFGHLSKTESGEMYLNSYYTDLSEQEKRELSFRETVPFILEAIMESSTDLTFAKDKEFKYICCSHTFAHFAGCEDSSQVVGKTDYELFDKQTADQFRADDIQLLKDGKSIIDMVEPIPSTDGIAHYSSTSKYLLKDTFGNAIGLYGLGRDITEYRNAYERLQLITENIPGGIAMLEIGESSLRVLYFNEGFYNFSGYTKAEYQRIMDEEPFSLIFEEDGPVMLEALNSLRDGRTKTASCSYRCNVKDGGYRWFNMKGEVSEVRGDKLIVNVVQFDITEQKRGEELARIHEEEMRIAMSRMGKMICEYNPETHVMTMPKAYADWYAMSTVVKNVPYNKQDLATLEPEHLENYVHFFESIINGDKSGSLDARLRRKDGTLHWEHYEFVSVFGDDGKPKKAIFSVEDVTDFMETKSRYEHEMQLRRELIRDSVIYYQINITNNTIDEYISKYSDEKAMHSGKAVSGSMERDILANVAAGDRKMIEKTMFSAPLLNAYNNGKRNISIEYRRLVPGGGLRWMRANAALMKRPDTDEIVAFVYVSDIDAEKKNILAIECLMAEEIESLVMVNVISGLAHKIKTNADFGNMEENEIFNFDEYITEAIIPVIVPEDVRSNGKAFLLEGLVRALENEPSIVFTYRMHRKDGSVVRKRSLAFYLDESRCDIVISSRDITWIYEEEQRQKLTLQRAVDSANDANRAKSDFLSRMSHDMRTPMNAIIGLVSLAKDENNPKKTEEYLENIDYSSHLLLGLINDVLDLSRIESGKVSLHEEQFSLEEFRRNINTVIKPLMDAKNITLEFVSDCEDENIVVDKVRFTQIFFNLLSNAAKYTQPGGRVVFSAMRMPDVNGKCAISYCVKDTGCGMSKDFLKIAFDPFAQERLNSTEIQGSGLGLAIVKSLVESMGGTIKLDSELNVGTSFTVELYTDRSTNEKSEKTVENSSLKCLEGLRILLVEDNSMNILVARNLLEKKGCMVNVATNGLKAVELFSDSAEGYYGTILMDIRMPVMNGLDAARKIRSLKRADAAAVPIIAMTADVFDEDRDKTLEAGMNAHIAKPIVPQLLFDAIAEQVIKQNVKGEK